VRAALLVESWTGNTWRAAELVGDLLQQEQWTITGLSKVRAPDYGSIQAADVVLVGTWVHGAFVVGQAPWAVNEIANLPAMRGKRAAAFCTYALNPGRSLDKLTRALGDTGAYVIGGLEMHRRHLDEHSEVFASRLLEAVAPA
jgi:flavodoxin